jgi:hypothetical protein
MHCSKAGPSSQSSRPSLTSERHVAGRTTSVCFPSRSSASLIMFGRRMRPGRFLQLPPPLPTLRQHPQGARSPAARRAQAQPLGQGQAARGGDGRLWRGGGRQRERPKGRPEEALTPRNGVREHAVLGPRGWHEKLFAPCLTESCAEGCVSSASTPKQRCRKRLATRSRKDPCNTATRAVARTSAANGSRRCVLAL